MEDKADKARAFYDKHKNEIGIDFRASFLSLPKEDLYDFLDVIWQDKINGLRQLLQESEITAKRLAAKLEEQKEGEEEVISYWKWVQQNYHVAEGGWIYFIDNDKKKHSISPSTAYVLFKQQSK